MVAVLHRILVSTAPPGQMWFLSFDMGHPLSGLHAVYLHEVNLDLTLGPLNAKFWLAWAH